MEKRKGFTLIEVLIALSLVLIIIITAYNVMKFSLDGWTLNLREYDIQSAVRKAMDTSTEKIRYSYAIFTLPKDSFREDNLTEEWSYIGLHEVTIKGKPASEVLEYIYDPDTKTHKKNILVEAREDVLYDLVFSKKDKDMNNTLLEYSIVGYTNGKKSKPFINVVGETKALNTMQIVDVALKKTSAIAYRTSKAVLNYANISFIIDFSDSMNYNLEGKADNIPLEDQRRTFLKAAANKLITSLATQNSIRMSIIKFASSAYFESPFYNVMQDTDKLLDIYKNIRGDGNTNAGDACRIAYYSLKKLKSEETPRTKALNYVILFTDGDSCLYTVYDRYSKNYNFYMEDDFVENERWKQHVAGLGTVFDADAIRYIGVWGDKLRELNTKVYLIALSNSATDYSIALTKDALHVEDKNVFVARNVESLDKAFESIQEDILKDLWIFNGPKI